MEICFFAFSNESVMASLLLRMFCDHDVRFVYLSRCLRFWAKQHKLTSEHAGRYLINFSLTHLLIYYLQQLHILPTTEQILRSGEFVRLHGRATSHQLAFVAVPAMSCSSCDAMTQTLT